MRKRKYDLILPFGEACHTAHTLKRLKYRTMSCPFDWMYGLNFEGRFKIILNKFEGFFNKEDLEFVGIDAKCDNYKNTRTQLNFNHDFPQGVDFNEYYPIVAKKYERRITRVLEKLNKKSSILLLYIDLPTTKEFIGNEKLKELFSQIKDVYPKSKIDLLYIKHNPDLKPKEVIYEKLTENITIVFCNNKSTDPKVLEWQANYENTKQALKYVGIKNYLINYIRYRINKIKNKLNVQGNK